MKKTGLFGFIKKCFYRISTFIDFNKSRFVKLYFNEQSRMQSTTTNVNVNSSEPVFFLLVLKQVNVVVFVTISMIHIPNCVL